MRDIVPTSPDGAKLRPPETRVKHGFQSAGHLFVVAGGFSASFESMGKTLSMSFGTGSRAASSAVTGCDDQFSVDAAGDRCSSNLPV